MRNVIPQPVSIKSSKGTYTLIPEATICVASETEEILHIAQYLADKLRPATGYNLPVLATNKPSQQGSIFLTTHGTDSTLGDEGYELKVEPKQATLSAYRSAGLFHGIQTIRQLLPPGIETGILQPGPWQIETGIIRDYPRFIWRGAMLDVARHFFKMEDIKRYIDQLAYYKFNVFHLHLTDDQGWRIMINSWPDLAKHGGSTQVNGGCGGYYTQEEYNEIVAFARARYITIVPEVDMPGHTNAALASYPELNSSGKAPKLYTGSKVGFSSLCISKEITYKFVEDVVREIATLTPGPYFHIGGDEAQATDEAEYRQFIKRIQEIVQAQGKQVVGWEEIGKADILPSTVVQYWWNSEWALKAIQRENKIVLSPADRAYLDIKYNASTSFGQDWTQRYTEVQDAYDWEPSSILEGLQEDSILGIEAAVWTETIVTVDDLDFMTYPRLCGYGEIAWTPAEKRNWSEYRLRLAEHGPRMLALGINFYRSPKVEWD